MSGRTLRADVCVIGSGAGGAVVAAELADRGLDVVVLEEGPERDARQATGRPQEALPRFYRDGGQVVALGRRPVMLPLGRGTGGTTFVNSGTCFRTPPSVLDRFAREHGIEGLNAGHFERVEEAFGVHEVSPALAGRNAAIIRRGAERLGWSGGYLQRNARGCQGSGVCAFGCPTGAKQHAGEVYLPRARAAGARIVTQARAERILLQGRRAAGVQGRGLEVRAPRVVVAAGAIHTPLLLARSGLGGPALGRHLTVHPATAVWGVFDEEIDMSAGVPQSYYVDEFADEGLVLEGIAGPPDYLALATPLAGDRLRELMLRHRHVAQCGLMISDSTRGRVGSLLGRPVVRYGLGDADVRTIRAGVRRLEQLMRAAGAREVILPPDRKVMGFHPLGTARAHRDPRQGAVDGSLRVHGAEGVHVADGSAVPGPIGVNPQITIMALATRLADHLATEEAACRS